MKFIEYWNSFLPSAAWVAAILLWLVVDVAAQDRPSPGAKPAGVDAEYVALCAGCHGPSAGGSDRGPALADSRKLRKLSENDILGIIRDGTQGGMPPFKLPAGRLRRLAQWVHALNASAYDLAPPVDTAAGERFFFGQGRCASCHMIAGRGGTKGPDLSGIGRQLTRSVLEQALDDPASRAGNRSSSSCPGWAWCPENPWEVVSVRLRDGSRLRGFARGRGKHDLQLQTFDGRFHFLLDDEYDEIIAEETPLMPPLDASPEQRRDLLSYLSRRGGIVAGPLSGDQQEEVSAAEILRVMEPQAGEWPTYNGLPSGNRHSQLDQINTENVARLQLQWTYSIPYTPLEMTPLVSGGMMFVTGPNRVCALDSRTGSQVWCYSRPRTPAGGISGDAALGANRGVAILGDRVFFNTDDARLICLNRITGALMWDVLMADQPGPYGATAAPLVVGDLVITGIGGGDQGIRGFLDAYKATTGERAWRFWTIPKPGEPGSETWAGSALPVGGGATWLTGSYDAETGLLYWPTGNPFPDTDGTERGGDNLYTNSVVALEARTGKLRWHFQYTPHDLHDWDATEPLLVVNTRFQGRDRKLLLQATRNGFYYVLDRVTGEFLLGEPFVKRLTWASGIDSKGVPQLKDGNRPTPLGVVSCPAVRGATNWYSTAFHPATRLLYVMAVEDCTIYQQAQLGGYAPHRDPANPPAKFLRALDLETGKIVWEIEQVGPPAANYSGVLSTAGGLVFYGETGGGFAAVDAKTGKTLWHFETNEIWKGSPMTYRINGRQYVAIAAGGNVLAFALPRM